MTVLDADFSVDPNGTDIDNELLYTGRRRDPETGLQLNRNRFYHAPLGRWINRDPSDYRGSEWNLYEYVKSRPLGSTDPTGLVPCAPFPLGCPPSPANCSHYNAVSTWWKPVCKCIAGDETRVCRWTPNGPWSNCVRACLQRCNVAVSWMGCTVSFPFCHGACFSSCTVNPGAPAY